MLDDSQRSLLLERYVVMSRLPIRMEVLRCGLRPVDPPVGVNVRFARKQPGGTLVLWDDHLVFFAHGPSSAFWFLLAVGLGAFVSVFYVVTAVLSGRDSFWRQMWFAWTAVIALPLGLDWLARRPFTLKWPGMMSRATGNESSLMIPLESVTSVTVKQASRYKKGCSSLWVNFRDQGGDPIQLAVVPQPGLLGWNRKFDADGWCADISERLRKRPSAAALRQRPGRLR